MNKKLIVTPKGYSVLKAKVAYLEKANSEVIEKLSLASLDGDLSENADFLILNEKKTSLSGEIAKYRSLLEKAEICRQKNSNSAQLGSRITYLLLDQKKKFTVELTDVFSANPPQKVSVSSPFGQQFLGKKVGEIIQAKIQILAID